MHLSASLSSSSSGSIVTSTPTVTQGKRALVIKLISCSYNVYFNLILLLIPNFLFLHCKLSQSHLFYISFQDLILSVVVKF